MDFAFTAEAGLAGLFLASFLSATLLPGGSEVVLIAVVHRHPDQVTSALVLATLGNTLGGMTTYGIARLLPQRVGADGTAADRVRALRRHGAPLRLFAWAPIIGDASVLGRDGQRCDASLALSGRVFNRCRFVPAHQ